MVKPKISIIIPTYNRSHLIIETLDSIFYQTYSNWECIIVDDGSTDNTEDVVQSYIKKDGRFRLYKRPSNKPKGANACRNFGFEKSVGEFINWFDSDDFMMNDNLEQKLKAFNQDIDFVVANTINYDAHGNLSRPYHLDYNIPITSENFIGLRIGWITNDVLIRRSAVSLAFNEKLNSGQEYNFFSRLLYRTTKGKYLKQDLARRRIHSESIQQNLSAANKDLQYLEIFNNEKILLNDIKELASLKIRKRSVKRLVRYSYYLSKKRSINSFQKITIKELFENKLYKSLLYYLFWTVSNLTIGKGYYFLRRAMKL